jgi:hypothetical protein
MTFPGGEREYLSLDRISRMERLLAAFVPWVCGVCLCSDYFACKGGCSWADPQTCSRCVT